MKGEALHIHPCGLSPKSGQAKLGAGGEAIAEEVHLVIYWGFPGSHAAPKQSCPSRELKVGALIPKAQRGKLRQTIRKLFA